jgi:predicted nuclease of predicted toxin-antitoxin system
MGTSVPAALDIVGKNVRWHDVVFAGRAATDPEIIQAVAQNGWVLVTRDKRIERRPAEIKAIKDSAAKCIVLIQRVNLTRWDMLQRLVCSWEEIEGIVDSIVGPFILKLYRRGRPVKRAL